MKERKIKQIIRGANGEFVVEWRVVSRKLEDYLKERDKYERTEG